MNDSPENIWHVSLQAQSMSHNLVDRTFIDSCCHTSTRAPGAVFEVTRSGDGWTFSTLYRFADPALVLAAVTLYNGDLYGTTEGGGSADFGSVFELMPGTGGWTANTLYSFTSGNDGSHPVSSVLLDSSGNVYGTAMDAGVNSDGTIWEITPSTKP